MQTRFMDKDVMVREGEFFLIPPGMTHSHIYYRDDPHEGVCFRWRFRPVSGTRPDAGGQGLFERLSLLKDWPPGAYRDDYGIRPLLVQLFHEAEAGRSPLYLQLLLVQFLEILTSIPGSGRLAIAEPGETKDALVRKVEIYLEDFHGERLNVEELAASLHMSYGHLSRLYKRKTGRTLIEEMNRIRLAKACELLLKPELLVKEVAEQSGFPDIYYFSKAFKKKHGVSPQAYRKQHLGREEPRQGQRPLG